MIGRARGTTSSRALSGVRTTDGEASSGSHVRTGLSSSKVPSSTNVIVAAATIGLVTEASRMTASRGIAAGSPSVMTPAVATSTAPSWSTSATAPGTLSL